MSRAVTIPMPPSPHHGTALANAIERAREHQRKQVEQRAFLATLTPAAPVYTPQPRKAQP